VSESEVVFLFAGAIVPDKGVIHLARAFAQIARQVSSVHLALAGSSGLWGPAETAARTASPYENDVRKALAEPFKAGRVHMLGNVSYVDMPGTYAASDALILPSIVKEGCPLTVLEALAAGRPVIASGLGGTPELTTPETGTLVPPGDDAALVTAMQTLTEHPVARQKASVAARRRSADFSWDAVARRLEAIYDDAPLTSRAALRRD
jgi:glycosyltransferase involved in cell wall biosynthesis